MNLTKRIHNLMNTLESIRYHFYNIGVGNFLLSNRYPLVIPQYEAVDSMKVEQCIPIVPCEHELYSMSDWCIWSSGSTRSRMWPFKIDVFAGSSKRHNGKEPFSRKVLRLNQKKTRIWCDTILTILKLTAVKEINFEPFVSPFFFF